MLKSFGKLSNYIYNYVFDKRTNYVKGYKDIVLIISFILAVLVLFI